MWRKIVSVELCGDKSGVLHPFNTHTPKGVGCAC